MMAANGMSDLRIELSPVGENSCWTRLAGLSRSNLNDSASGAKTKPPCAYPARSDITSAANSIGKIQRIASTLVQKRRGPFVPMESELAESSVFRKKFVQ